MSSREVKDFLSNVFPSIDREKRTQLENIANKLGVEEVDDLQLIEESDVCPPLTKIQFRKLAKCSKEGSVPQAAASSGSGGSTGTQMNFNRANQVGGRDAYGGDNIRASNMAKIDRSEGTVNVGGQHSNFDMKGGAITGDQLHFGFGGNMKY